jgi:hypothetical protein
MVNADEFRESAFADTELPLGVDSGCSTNQLVAAEVGVLLCIAIQDGQSEYDLVF